VLVAARHLTSPRHASTLPANSVHGKLESRLMPVGLTGQRSGTSIRFEAIDSSLSA